MAATNQPPERRNDFLIRHATPADHEAVSRIFAGPRAVWGTFQIPFPSPELWRRRLSDATPGKFDLIACVDGDVVGILGITTHPDRPRRRHAAELGMTVRDDWQGRGAGTALMKAATDLADNWLNLERLELSVFTDNEPALRLYRKFGFEIEGTLRRFAFRDGRFVDALMMARLRAISAG